MRLGFRECNGKVVLVNPETGEEIEGVTHSVVESDSPDIKIISFICYAIKVDDGPQQTSEGAS